MAADQPAARADKIVSGLMEGVSRSRVQKALDLGLITLGGKSIDRRTVLNPGDEIVIALPTPEEPTATAVKMKLEVLFEDAHLIAINKPTTAGPAGPPTSSRPSRANTTTAAPRTRRGRASGPSDASVARHGRAVCQ